MHQNNIRLIQVHRTSFKKNSGVTLITINPDGVAILPYCTYR